MFNPYKNYAKMKRVYIISLINPLKGTKEYIYEFDNGVIYTDTDDSNALVYNTAKEAEQMADIFAYWYQRTEFRVESRMIQRRLGYGAAMSGEQFLKLCKMVG